MGNIETGLRWVMFIVCFLFLYGMLSLLLWFIGIPEVVAWIILILFITIIAFTYGYYLVDNYEKKFISN